MDTEIEAKFINQYHDVIRTRLKAAGAVCVQPERLMIRANYDYPDDSLANNSRGWVRIRDEGDKVTLSYKQSDDKTLHGTQEINIQIDSFDKAHAFLQAIGMTKRKALQQTKRESWELDGVQIELDTWPWLQPFVELEAPNEALLRKVADKLGLDIANALHGSVIPAYQAEYDITENEMANWPEYRFDLPVPEFFGSYPNAWAIFGICS